MSKHSESYNICIENSDYDENNKINKLMFEPQYSKQSYFTRLFYNVKSYEENKHEIENFFSKKNSEP